MNKHKKGEYGYLSAYKKNKLIGSVVLALMIIFIVVTVLLMFGSTKRVAIVFAILLTLPFAKVFIGYIVVAKFRPLSKVDYDYIINSLADINQYAIYDVTICQYEGMKFYPAMAVKNENIYAYIDEKTFVKDKKQHIAWINNAVSMSKYEYKVYVTKDLKDFVKKIKTTGQPDENAGIIDKHIKELILEKGV